MCVGSLDEGPSLVVTFTPEYPLAVSNGREVFVLDPRCIFVGMSSFGPPPQGLEDSIVYFGKSLAAGSVLMVVCPAPNDWIE